jgi:hypothetical protein
MNCQEAIKLQTIYNCDWKLVEKIDFLYERKKKLIEKKNHYQNTTPQCSENWMCVVVQILTYCAI